MASLIPGYEYDIFISYRQKYNKHYGKTYEANVIPGDYYREMGDGKKAF